MDLLKELETALKNVLIMLAMYVGESKDIGDSQNTKSPIGA